MFETIEKYREYLKEDPFIDANDIRDNFLLHDCNSI